MNNDRNGSVNDEDAASKGLENSAASELTMDVTLGLFPGKEETVDTDEAMDEPELATVGHISAVEG